MSLSELWVGLGGSFDGVHYSVRGMQVGRALGGEMITYKNDCVREEGAEWFFDLAYQEVLAAERGLKDLVDWWISRGGQANPGVRPRVFAYETSEGVRTLASWEVRATLMGFPFTPHPKGSSQRISLEDFREYLKTQLKEHPPKESALRWIMRQAEEMGFQYRDEMLMWQDVPVAKWDADGEFFRTHRGDPVYHADHLWDLRFIVRHILVQTSGRMEDLRLLWDRHASCEVVEEGNDLFFQHKGEPVYTWKGGNIFFGMPLHDAQGCPVPGGFDGVEDLVKLKLAELN